MKQIYKTEIWQGGSGYWYVNINSHLASPYATWWMPARILGIPLDEYIVLLKDKFNAELKYNADKQFLLCSWKNYSDANRYKLYINKAARDKKVYLD